MLSIFTQIKAQKTADIVKKVLKATSEFENYDIKFEKYFKFQSEKDTIKEIYESVVCRTDIEYNIGWHRIYQHHNMAAKSLIAINAKEAARLNFKDHLYYNQLLADDEKKVIQTVQSQLFHPLTRFKEDYKGFEVMKTDEPFISLQKLDTIRDAGKRVKLINKTILSINKSTYLPEVEESWTWFSNGGLQYSKYRLLDYKISSGKRFESVLKTSDSLVAYIKSFTNGDSLKEKNKKVYRQVRIGDTASIFRGTKHQGETAFDFSALSDSIVILDFFYTTCGPCMAAIPEINKFYQANLNRGISVLGVDPFSSDWPKLELFITEKSVTYPIIKTPQDVVLAYGVTGYPRMFVIKNGVIIKIYYGFAKGLEKELQQLVDGLIKG